MRVLISGGGTAGHINPAIAIGKYIEKKEPGSTLLFVGREVGMEKKLIEREGYKMEYIDVEGLKRSLTFENVRVLKKLMVARKKCRKIIRDFKPDLVVGTGGYVCVPLLMEAAKMKIKTLIHEQNVIPGVAVKLLAKSVNVTAISFPETKEYLPKANCLLTGNPLRESILAADEASCRESLGLGKEPLVLMFGGSLGAEHMNDALVEMISRGGVSFRLIAATGEKHYDSVMKRLEGVKIPENVEIHPYLYEMDRYLAAADLVVSRAGAVTIGEINALGKAAVLIPSPYVAHNHQEKNARVLEKNGAAKVLTENNLSGETLRETILSVISKEEVLASMREASGKMGMTEACAKIYRAIR